MPAALRNYATRSYVLMTIDEAAAQIDTELGDRTRARCPRARVEAMLHLDGRMRAPHINALKNALEMRSIGMFELDSGALGLLRIRALEGAQQL